MNIWDELGIAPTGEVREIRRAYAARLKLTSPEDDADGFQRLRIAYERAIALQARRASLSLPPEASPEPEPKPRSQRQDAAPQITEENTTAATTLPSPSNFVSAPNPATAAEALLQQLLGAEARDWKSILSEQSLRPGWEALDFQARLQAAVLLGLLSGYDRYERLVEPLMRHFGWESSRYQGTWFQRPIAELQDRHHARQLRLAIERSKEPQANRRRAALALLSHPVDVPRFRRFARLSYNNDAMRDLLQALSDRARSAARFEINVESAHWFQDYLQTFPLTWDRAAGLLFFGTLAAPLLMMAINAVILFFWGWNTERDARAWEILTPLSVASFFAVDAISRTRKRAYASGHPDRVARLLQRWRNEPGPKRFAMVLTAVCLLLSLRAEHSPVFAVAAVLGAALLVFWTHWRIALAMLGSLAWGLHAIIWIVLEECWTTFPILRQVAPETPRWIAPHLLAAYLVIPYTRAVGALLAKARKRPLRDPTKTAFYLSLLLAVLVFALVTSLQPRDPPSKTPVALLPLDTLLPSGLAIPTAPQFKVTSQPAQAPEPVAGAKHTEAVPRPAAPFPNNIRQWLDVDAVVGQNRSRFRPLFETYARTHGPVTQYLKMVVAFTIGPEGAVTECHIAQSNFRNTALEDAVKAQFRQINFGGTRMLPFSGTETFDLAPQPRGGPPPLVR